MQTWRDNVSGAKEGDKDEFERLYERRNTNRHSIKPQFPFLPAGIFFQSHAKSSRDPEARGEQKADGRSEGRKGSRRFFERGNEKRAERKEKVKPLVFARSARFLTAGECLRLVRKYSLENIRCFMISRNRRVEATQGNLLEGKLNLKNLSAEKASSSSRVPKLQTAVILNF
jgi:hypothetical protein